MKRLATILLCFFMVPLASVAPIAAADDLLNDVLERGTLRVGFSSFVPWAMRDKNGGFIGFEVDVAREVAKDMGVELELVPTAWDGIIPALLAGKFDVVISGMSITPARNLQVNFTAPYAQSGLGLVANRKLSQGLASLEDFNDDGVTFALRRGAYPVEFVKQNLPKARILQFDDEASARQEVINGRAHAWITSAPEHRFAAADHPKALHVPVDELFSRSVEGMALRKGDVDALNFFNGWVRVKHESGWLAERHAYWFGGDRPWAGQIGAE